MDGEGFAADVARSLDGGVLETGWLDNVLAGGRRDLQGFAAPEGGAFRGMMSDGCRLRLRWADGGDEREAGDGGSGAGAGGSARPATAFYKRVVMGDLESTRLKALAAPKKNTARRLPAPAKPAPLNSGVEVMQLEPIV